VVLATGILWDGKIFGDVEYASLPSDTLSQFPRNFCKTRSLATSAKEPEMSIPPPAASTPRLDLPLGLSLAFGTTKLPGALASDIPKFSLTSSVLPKCPECKWAYVTHGCWSNLHLGGGAHHHV